MKKAVMLSVNPKSCSWIALGIKTVYIRKTRPKLELPFKVYVYCTKPGTKLACIIKDGDDIYGETYHGKTRFIKVEKSCYTMFGKSQKVIGEFICDEIRCATLSDLIVKEDAEKTLQGTLMEKQEVLDYLGYKRGTSIHDAKHYGFYLWHISNFKLYDHPRETDDFFTDKDCECDHKNCKYFDRGNGYNVEDDCLAYYGKPLFKAPQSWCYVKEV